MCFLVCVELRHVVIKTKSKSTQDSVTQNKTKITFDTVPAVTHNTMSYGLSGVSQLFGHRNDVLINNCEITQTRVELLLSYPRME